MTYRTEVVDPNDRVSQLAAQVCVQSRGNNPFLEAVDRSRGSFRGMVGFRWSRSILEAMMRREICELPQADGAGHKPQAYSFLGNPLRFRQLAWELAAMNYDDIAITGGLPVAMLSSIIDAARATPENLRHFEAIFAGATQMLADTKTIMLTGETALMRYAITAFCDEQDPRQLLLCWGGTALGLMADELPRTQVEVEPNMAIIGLLERGHRCNGTTRLIDIARAVYGNDQKTLAESHDAAEFFGLVASPSICYANFLSKLYGWREDGTLGEMVVPIAAAAHITGGGFAKFREVLPEGMGATFNELPRPPQVLWQAQKLSETTDNPLSDFDMYDTFGGGVGAMLVVRKDYVGRVCTLASEDSIDAQPIGFIQRSNNRELAIRSKFAMSTKATGGMIVGYPNE